MIAGRPYDAVLLDLDGTLLDARGEIRPRNADALHALVARGVHVMIATGRSTMATLPAVRDLELETPMLVFNGAAFYCPRSARFVEERVLSNRAVQRAREFGRERDLLTVLQLADEKYATPPRNTAEERALAFFHGLRIVEREALPAEYLIRAIYFSEEHETSEALRDEVRAHVDAPCFLTHFPLDLLVTHRGSPLKVVDLHPPMRGKAEGLRFLAERHGVRPERVVAIGDAGNDLEMLRAAGLGVAMGEARGEVREVADRVIGSHDSDAIAELLEELFGPL
jgi:Cof subfamily protein (haloacid dehalogenase superfamily)